MSNEGTEGDSYGAFERIREWYLSKDFWGDDYQRVEEKLQNLQSLEIPPKVFIKEISNLRSLKYCVCKQGCREGFCIKELGEMHPGRLTIQRQQN